MKNIISLLLIVIFSACTSSNNKEKQSQANASDTAIISASIDSSENNIAEDSVNHDIEKFFIIIADTGTDFYSLNKKMYDLNKQLQLPIDTMNRYFNKKKNSIVLHENDEDKLYAGHYFPRRFPSESLSLEYLDVYQDDAGKKTFALVTGIYEKNKSADSALAILKSKEKNAFKIKADINVGCVH